MSGKDKFVNIHTINRQDSLLNLSDKFIFSDQKEEENQDSLDKLIVFEKEELLKIKISSFCSHENREAEQFKEQESRVFQELGSRSYIWSFSIFEILPEEILLSHLDKVFYCSFIFAFRNPHGGFNYYNIAQQSIDPSFSSDHPINKLSLIRETESGDYLPISSTLIKGKDLYKILLLNETEIPVENYHLFCEGLKVITVPGIQLNTFPIFVNLINHPDLSGLSEGIKRCRIFSKSNNKIMGMTKPFELNLSDLKNETYTVNLGTINEPVIMDTDQKIRKEKIPLNNYFYFSSLREINESTQDYSFIEIIVNTQWFNKKVFGKGKVVSETYTLSLRERFPVMVITPESVFMMDTMSYKSWLRRSRRFLKEKDRKEQDFYLIDRTREMYTVSCIYKIHLIDRHKPDNKKEFEDRVYLINWNNKSYGVGYSPLPAYKLVSPFVDSEKRGIMRKQFLRLEDINKAGHLNFNFFDVVDDRSFHIEGYKVDHIALKCYSRKNEDGSSNPITVSWPYDTSYSPVLLRTFFINSDIRTYIMAKTLVICRLIIYEDKILRYFSGYSKTGVRPISWTGV